MALNIVMGVPGSGRTHFIERQFCGWKHFSVGDYQSRLKKERGNAEMDSFAYRLLLLKANEEIKGDVITALREGCDVVLEHTLYKAKRRIAYIDEFRIVTDTPINIYVVMPSEKQLRNNLISSPNHCEEEFNRLRREMDDIELPNIAEGYEKIFIVRDGIVEELIAEIDTNLIKRAKEELVAEKIQEKEREQKQKEKEELLQNLNKNGFWHYCEVCGKKEHLTPEEAFNEGWDYPPRIGVFTALSPRTCGKCSITDTLWWKLVTDKNNEHNMNTFTDKEKKTIIRIMAEPYSLLEEDEQEQ